jgi:hypothetical protein
LNIKNDLNMKNRIVNRVVLATLSIVLVSFTFLLSSCEDETEKLPDGVTRIYVKTLPKVAFALDAPLDLTGMEVAVERGSVTTDVPFSEFEKEGISVEPPNGTILGFQHQSLIIRHAPSGKGITQPLDITNRITLLSVKVPPVENYEIAENLDLSTLVINLVRENGETSELAFDDFKEDVVCEPAHGDLLSIANNKVVVTYLPTNVKTEISIKVNPFMPVSSVIKIMPDKVDYGMGEKLQLAGLVMEYDLGSGKTREITYEMFHLFGIETSLKDNEVLGKTDTKIAVSYSASGVSSDLNITVDPYLDVKAIHVKTFPEKLFYNEGDLIDLSGMEIIITRVDSVELDIPLEYFSKVDLVINPVDGVEFALSMPKVIITHTPSGIYTSSPLKMAIPASALEVLISEASPEKWVIRNYFDVGEMPYSDKSNLVVATFPHEFRGLQWIQTTFDLMFNTDKQVAALKLPAAYTVYFVHCKLNGAPAWLTTDNWTETDLTLTVNRIQYIVYKKDFQLGEEVKLYEFSTPTTNPAPPYFLVLERL